MKAKIIDISSSHEQYRSLGLQTSIATPSILRVKNYYLRILLRKVNKGLQKQAQGTATYTEK